jgi:hypothetical protein
VSKRQDPGPLSETPALYSADPQEARAAAEKLAQLVRLEVVDIRTAMPALAYALTRPELELQRAAFSAIYELGFVGGHIEFAVPALLLHRAHPDLELRRGVWESLADICSSNNPTARVAILQPFAESALADPDEQVRKQAQRALDKLAARRGQRV